MTVKLLIGDCREKLKELPDESIDCVVTSPPYWGLRDYKTEPLIWDGAPGCEHEWDDEHKVSTYTPSSTTSVGNELNGSHNMDYIHGICQKCGAWRGQLGLEPDPNLYIKHLSDIFDQVKRVLKPSGTCWVNLGDSYGGSGKGYGGGDHGKLGKHANDFLPKPSDNSIQDKCLVQIPSRFALEMTARGWILRNEIIWHKPNCMPSSVTDRFTVDFEKVFFFVKSKRYYFKQQYEQATAPPGNPGPFSKAGNADRNDTGRIYIPNESGNRNKRTVWTIITKPYSGSHFAVFPIDLIAPMIDAGCPSDGAVLDPFSGSGTVLEYARKHGLNGVGIELNPEYKGLATDRALLNVPEITDYE